MTKMHVSNFSPFFCDLVPRLCFMWFQKPGNNTCQMYLAGLAWGQLLQGPATGTFPMLGNSLPSKNGPTVYIFQLWMSRTWSCSWFTDPGSSLKMIEIRQTLSGNTHVVLRVSEIHFPELCFNPPLCAIHLHITWLHPAHWTFSHSCKGLLLSEWTFRRTSRLGSLQQSK